MFSRIATTTTPQTRMTGYRSWYPYALGFIALIAFFAFSHVFWRSNDDVSMMLISRGHGIAAHASPRLILTNIVWGYLVQVFPDFGRISTYTWLTYLALALAYFALLYCFLRRRLQHWLAALAMLFVFAPTLILPQFTLVAGYLAFAALVLLWDSIETRSLWAGAAAGLLLVLSGLLRADETALVVLVAIPVCFGRWREAFASDLRWRWLGLGVATAAVFAGLQLLDYFTFSSGDWAWFGRTYALRTEFTDFHLATWFLSHPKSLIGTGYSENDLKLFANWFYVDPQVFSPDKLQVLLHKLPVFGRFKANLKYSHQGLVPLHDREFLVLLGLMLLVSVFHRRRWHFLASVLVLGGLMVLLLLLGRPQVTRIYVPACAGLLLIGILEMRIEAYILSALAVAAALAVSLPTLYRLHHDNDRRYAKSLKAHATTCKLPTGFYIVWGAIYPFQLQYTPFADPDSVCPLDYYSFGEFSLAPYALDHLHQHTGGKDFIQAMLSGQSFDFISGGSAMLMLRGYFRDHYGVHLVFKTTQKTRGRIQVFYVSLDPTWPSASASDPGRR